MKILIKRVRWPNCLTLVRHSRTQFKGNKVKITQIDLENKRTNYKGILTEVTEKNILLDQNDNLVSIKLDKICDAKLLV